MFEYDGGWEPTRLTGTSPIGGPRRDVARGEGTDGVAVGITPWNYPMPMAVQKVAPDCCRMCVHPQAGRADTAHGLDIWNTPRRPVFRPASWRSSHLVPAVRRCAARHGSPRGQGRIHRLPRRRQDHDAFRRGYGSPLLSLAASPRTSCSRTPISTRRSRGRPTGLGVRAKTAWGAHASIEKEIYDDALNALVGRAGERPGRRTGAIRSTAMGLSAKARAGMRRALHRHDDWLAQKEGELLRRAQATEVHAGQPPAATARSRRRLRHVDNTAQIVQEEDPRPAHRCPGHPVFDMEQVIEQSTRQLDGLAAAAVWTSDVKKAIKTAAFGAVSR